MMKSVLKTGLVALFALAPLVYAAQPIGHVVWVQGTMTASGRPLVRGAPVYAGEVLSTDSASQANVEFSDGSLMTLKHGTNFAVNQYEFNKKKNTGSFVSNMTTGGFRTITGLIAKNHPSNYQVNTPVATIGVRGTDYQAVLANGALYVAVLSGQVCLDTGECPSGNQGLLNWASNPSVYMPQVLAVPDSRKDTRPVPACTAVPILTAPFARIPAVGSIITPGTFIVDASTHFTGSPLFFSLTVEPIPATPTNIPPNSITINSTTGVITISLGPKNPINFGEYLVTVTASNRCGSASSSFIIDYDLA